MTQKIVLTKFIFFSFGILIILSLTFVFFKSSLDFALAQIRNQGNNRSDFRINVEGDQHYECQSGSCVLVSGPGDNECLTDADCQVSPSPSPSLTPSPTSPPGETHLECQAEEQEVFGLTGWDCSGCSGTSCSICKTCGKCNPDGSDCIEAFDCTGCTGCSFEPYIREDWWCPICQKGKFMKATCVKKEGGGYDPACEGMSEGSTCKIEAETGGDKILGCSLAVKIADDHGYTKAWTDRVNRIQNYDSSFTEINKNRKGVDGKRYETQCRPWGAILDFQTNSLTKYRSPDKFGCNEINAGPVYTGEGATAAVAGKLFIKSYEARYWAEGGTVSNYKPILPQNEDYSVWVWDGTSIGKPPEIDQIKINQQSSGTLIGQKYFLANLSFYAWADKNQMPIRGVVIFWGDGQSSGQDILLYARNRKPSCNTSTDGFGGSSAACQTKPFEAVHLYRCPTGQTCSFIPRVCLVDNWSRDNCALFGGTIRITP